MRARTLNGLLKHDFNYELKTSHQEVVILIICKTGLDKLFNVHKPYFIYKTSFISDNSFLIIFSVPGHLKGLTFVSIGTCQ